MAVVRRLLVDHRLMHVAQIVEHAVGRDGRNIFCRRTILLHRRRPSGQTVAVIWLAAIGTPVTEKGPCRHVPRVLVCHRTREFVELQRGAAIEALPRASALGHGVTSLMWSR